MNRSNCQCLKKLWQKLPISVSPMGLLWQSCKNRYKVWAHSHPEYISSLRDNSISFGCIWGDPCFLFLERTGSSYKRPDNSRTVIWQTAPLHENQHIACLSAFTTLWSSAVCQSINYPMPILNQTGIYVFKCRQTLSLCQISFLKIKKKKFQKL